jgi:cell wall-associated NlpC family hydrolase
VSVATLSPSTGERLIPGLTIIGAGNVTDVTSAIIGEPTFTRPLSGAISISMTCRDSDPRHPLQNSPTLTSRCYATYGGINFELTAVSKNGHNVDLTFVDAIAVALDRQKGVRTFNADTLTRQGIAKELGREVGVEVLCDPAGREVVHSAVERTEDQSSWDLFADLADGAGFRRFSDGRRVLFGSDEWLASLQSVQRFTEYTGPVHTVNYSWNTKTSADSCTIDVDAELWAVPPGQAFELEGLGLASGLWVVEEFARPLSRVHGTVKGTRRAIVVPEPPPEQTTVAGESGEANFIPDAASVSTPPAGKYGGVSLSGAQTAIATTIVKVALSRSLGRQGAVLGIMCAMQEASLGNPAGGDRDSVGSFQQRPSWGTAAQRRNVEYAAGAFYAALVKIKGWQSLPYGVAIQKVQISAYPDRYDQHRTMAEALYAAIAKVVSGTTASTSSSSAKAGTSAKSSGTGLDRIADEAVKIANLGLPYIFGGKNVGKGLDCSGFVAEVTKRAGRQLAGGSKEQYATARKAGVLCSTQEALKTRGAILFRMSGDPTHVAISLGDGRTAEARGTQWGVKVFPGAYTRQWTHGAKWVP